MDEVARAFREAHGPAVATLARVFGDLTLAEDAVQEAFVAALRHWPRHGIPSNPAGWIVTAARNRAVDELRRAARGRELYGKLAVTASTGAEERLEEAKIMRDDQMRLIFTCCHPALRVEHQVALTLRLIAGLGVDQVARSFLVSESVQDQGCAHPLSDPGRCGTTRAASRRAVGAVPDLQRRLRRPAPRRTAE